MLFSVHCGPSSVLGRRHRPLLSRRVSLAQKEPNSNSPIKVLIVLDQEKQPEGRNGVPCMYVIKRNQPDLGVAEEGLERASTWPRIGV